MQTIILISSNVFITTVSHCEVTNELFCDVSSKMILPGGTSFKSGNRNGIFGDGNASLGKYYDLYLPTDPNGWQREVA